MCEVYLNFYKFSGVLAFLQPKKTHESFKLLII